jgi:hypothetical protein
MSQGAASFGGVPADSEATESHPAEPPGRTPGGSRPGSQRGTTRPELFYGTPRCWLEVPKPIRYQLASAGRQHFPGQGMPHMVFRLALTNEIRAIPVWLRLRPVVLVRFGAVDENDGGAHPCLDSVSPQINPRYMPGAIHNPRRKDEQASARP